MTGRGRSNECNTRCSSLCSHSSHGKGKVMSSRERRKHKRSHDIAIETPKVMEEYAFVAEVGHRGGWDRVSN